MTRLDDWDKARLEDWAGKITCPVCGHVGFRVEYRKRMVAKPLGTFSLAGQQDKVSAVEEEVPAIICEGAGCDVQSEGRVQE